MNIISKDMARTMQRLKWRMARLKMLLENVWWRLDSPANFSASMTWELSSFASMQTKSPWLWTAVEMMPGEIKLLHYSKLWYKMLFEQGNKILLLGLGLKCHWTSNWKCSQSKAPERLRRPMTGTASPRFWQRFWRRSMTRVKIFAFLTLKGKSFLFFSWTWR